MNCLFNNLLPPQVLSLLSSPLTLRGMADLELNSEEMHMILKKAHQKNHQKKKKKKQTNQKNFLQCITVWRKGGIPWLYEPSTKNHIQTRKPQLHWGAAHHWHPSCGIPGIQNLQASHILWHQGLWTSQNWCHNSPTSRHSLGLQAMFELRTNNAWLKSLSSDTSSTK